MTRRNGGRPIEPTDPRQTVADVECSALADRSKLKSPLVACPRARARRRRVLRPARTGHVGHRCVHLRWRRRRHRTPRADDASRSPPCRTPPQIVEEDGPIIFPGLNTTTGERTLVLDHEGDDPTRGWRIYYAYPIDRPDCPVEQVIGTREFVDCDGATIGVEDLSPPESGVFPVVENQRVLYIDLAGVTATTTTNIPTDTRSHPVCVALRVGRVTETAHKRGSRRTTPFALHSGWAGSPETAHKRGFAAVSRRPWRRRDARRRSRCVGRACCGSWRGRR